MLTWIDFFYRRYPFEAESVEKALKPRPETKSLGEALGSVRDWSHG
jgi:hypothetical protein